MKRQILLVALIVIFTCSIALAQTKTMGRTADPVEFAGSKVEGLIGTPIANIGTFAKIGGVMTPIPFQVEEYTGDGELVLPEGPSKNSDKDPAFDGNDHVLFMIWDAGDKAAESELPAATTVEEVELIDPIDGTKAWVYLAAFADVAPKSDTDYVRFDPQSNMIYAQNYVMGFHPKAGMSIGHLEMTPTGGGSGKNQSDRLKIRFSAIAGGVAKIEGNEEKFTSKVTSWIDGPVRVVRRTKNRMVLFWKIPTPSAELDNIYYANTFEFPTRVDLPFDVGTFMSKPELRVSQDGNCAVGDLMFINEKNQTPVKIDGIMSDAEKSMNMGAYKWMSIYHTGGQYKGGWVSRIIYDKSSTPVVPELYYNDDKSEADGPEDVPGHCGDVGYRLVNLEKVSKGILKLTSVMYSVPDFDKSKVQSILNIKDAPIRVTATQVR